jgi:hypothetical protein
MGDLRNFVVRVTEADFLVGVILVEGITCVGSSGAAEARECARAVVTDRGLDASRYVYSARRTTGRARVVAWWAGAR